MESDSKRNLGDYLRSYFLLMIAICAAGTMMVYLKFLLVPFFIAKGIQFILEPLIVFLYNGRRPCSADCCHNRCGGNTNCCKRFFVFCRLPKFISVTIALLIAICVVGIVASSISYSISELIKDAPRLQENGQKIIASLIQYLNTHYGFELSKDDLLSDILAFFDLKSYLLSLASSVYAVIEYVLLIALFLVFMLYGSSYFADTATELEHRVVGGSLSPIFSKFMIIYTQVNVRIRSYIIFKSAISAVMGVITFVLFLALKIKLPFFWGLMTFFFNFVPSFGFFFAILLPLPFLILSANYSVSIIILSILLPTSFHFFIVNFIEPKVLGYTLNLNAVAVLICLFFWGSLWGVVGGIVSVPLFGIIRMFFMCLDFPLLNYFGRLFANDHEEDELLFSLTNLQKSHRSPPIEDDDGLQKKKRRRRKQVQSQRDAISEKDESFANVTIVNENNETVF